MGQKRLHQFSHAINRNTKTGSRRNIQAHYDLGNDFYQLFLDAETLLYSSASLNSPINHSAMPNEQKFRI